MVSMSQSEHDRRIDYIEFAVTDLAAAKSFYSAVFGWSFTDYGPEYASFFDGRLGGGFRQADQAGRGGPLVVLYSTELEDIEAKIKSNGGRIVRDTFEFPGGRRFHFTDPAGNELAVWSDL
jgi:predicted enzyme related to lactoylglutathione lyase